MVVAGASKCPTVTTQGVHLSLSNPHGRILACGRLPNTFCVHQFLLNPEKSQIVFTILLGSGRQTMMPVGTMREYCWGGKNL